MSNHSYLLDRIIKGNSGNIETKNIGRSAIDTKENAAFFNIGADDNLITTATVITMDRFDIGDEIFVQMAKDGESYLSSDPNQPAIHFVGYKISD